MPSNLIAGASWFAERGYRVFPLRPGSKLPQLNAWQEHATTDPDTLYGWFGGPSSPANYAVVTDDRLVVLDVDLHGERNGLDTLNEWQDEHGALPATLTVETASGGRHYYFSRPADLEIKKSANKLGSGLDIQTGNAYLVGPLSEIDGRPYSVIDPAPIVELPLHLRAALEAIAAPRRPAAPAAPVAAWGSSSPERFDRYTSSAVDGEISRLRRLHGSWNEPWDSTTYEVACNLIEIANSEWSALTLVDAERILFENAPRDAGFSDSRVAQKWRSALAKCGTAARPAPEGYRRPPAGSPSPSPLPAGSTALGHTATASSGTAAGESSAGSGGRPPAPPARPNNEREGWGERPDPERYFERGLLVEKLARAVSHELAIGPDGEIWHYAGGIYKPDPLELRRRLAFHLGDKYRPAHLAAVEQFVTALPEVPALSSGVPDERYINIRSGIYDWRARKLLPHDPELGSITQLPIDYDPAATCPEFDRYLADVIPADSIQAVWELTGYMLLFGNPLQKAVVLQGPGGNGKSTYLRVLNELIGEHNISALSLRQINEERFSVASLHGKVANIAGDIDSKYLGDASKFKQVVGGDLIDAERKFGQPFTFRPWAVPIFSVNDWWKTGDTSHGYFRRWLTIPFPYSVAGKEPLDERKLFAERSGIFNKATAALVALMDRGDWDLEQAHAIAELKRTMEQSADILSDWLDEDERISLKDPAATKVHTPRTVLYKRFKNWCNATSHKPMASTNFYKRMDQLGFELFGLNGTRMIRGIGLAPGTDTSDE